MPQQHLERNLHVEDNPAKNTQPAAGERKNPAAQIRIAYTPPMLRVYGSVSRLTMGTGGSAPDAFGMTAKPKPSDRTTKENIVRIGDHPLGIGLYLFDYKPEYRDATSHGRQLGVMADEVETVMPDAVCVHPNGYKMVDYAMLASPQGRRAIH